MNIDPKKTVSLTEARKNIFDIAEDVQHPDTHYLFTENGRPKAVMMSAEEFDAWQETVEVYQQFPNLDEDIRKAREEYARGETYSLEEVFTKHVSRSHSKKRKKRYR